MEFRVLGPLEVRGDDGVVAINGPMLRGVLAMLLLEANRPLNAERLAAGLWAETAPADAAKGIQVHVSRLRKALRGSLIATTPAGYRLSVRPGELDLEHFERLVEEGRRTLAGGTPERAAALVREALALWRGPPLADLAYVPFAAAEIARLEEQRLAALDLRVEADLAAGEHAALVGELQRRLAAEPARENVARQLMLALYRGGRQSEALAVYQRTRAHLSVELGLEPGPELRALETQILRHVPALDLVQPAEAEPPRRRAAAAFLPTPSTRTIGRERDIRILSALVERGEVRLVTITGPGGVGKTRLAMEVGAAMLSRFEDGVRWVELAGVAHADYVAPTLAHSLAVTPVPGETARDALERFLATRHMLLVIDNFEHVLAASELVAGFASSCPRLTVLVTSREALDLSAEYRFLASPLALPRRPGEATGAEIEQTAATAMFVAAMRRYDSAFEPQPSDAPTIARICARLDGLPLALELAAAQARFAGPELLAQRLNATLVGLGTGPRDAPDRQRTLRATLDWSHRLLSRDQQQALAAFAVFAGGATFESAQSVTGKSSGELEALIDKHLLHRAGAADLPPRLRMYEIVREYALERLAADPRREAVLRRHAEHYLALARATAPELYAHGELRALRELDREVDNIRAALAWSLDAAPELALALAGCMRRYWRIRRTAAEGVRVLDAALRRAGPQAAAHDRAEAQLGRSDLLFLLDRRAEGLGAAERALEIYRAAGDQVGVADALCMVASSALVVSDLDLARRRAREAYEQARAVGHERLMGRALGILAPALPASRRAEALEDAARLLSGAGNQRELAVMFANSAYSAIREGRPEEALALHERAEPVAASIGDALLSVLIQTNLGLAALLAGDFQRAREAFARQLGLCAQHGFRWQAADGLIGLAGLAVRDGDPERAATLLGAARPLGGLGDDSIHARVEADVIAQARERYDPARWRQAEEAGAAMGFAGALAYAASASPAPLGSGGR
jgi:predicted ATPase/DNA-binding SARP family transcriptional activator